MSDGGGGKEEEQEAGREIEKGVVSISQDYFFIENNPMFPCWYSHTNTPTAFCPLTEYLNKGDKSFHSELARGKSGPGRKCVQVGHGVGEERASRWRWGSMGLDGG